MWFYDADGRGQLTIDNLTAARTYTLPNNSGGIVLENVSNAQNYIPRWSDANGTELTTGLLYDDGTNVGVGTTDPSQELEVTGDVYATGGLYIGANDTNNLISTATAGSGSTTLYIGNESILASGDIGVSVQGYNGGLQSISGLTEAADQMLYTTASNTYALTGLTAFGRSLIDDVDDAAARATLNLEIGTDVQAWDTGLDDVSGLSPVDSTFIVGNGTNWVAETGNTARTSLGLGTGDSPTFTDLTLSSLVTDGVLYSTSGNINSEANLSVTRGGTGVGTLTDGGILLGSGTGAITVTAQPTNGQLLIGSTGSDPVLGTITADTGLSTTVGAGTIEFDIDLLGASDGTGVASNNSGLELAGGSSHKLALLQGCANDEILKWDDTAGEWYCTSDQGSGSGSFKMDGRCICFIS